MDELQLASSLSGVFDGRNATLAGLSPAGVSMSSRYSASQPPWEPLGFRG